MSEYLPIVELIPGGKQHIAVEAGKGRTLCGRGPGVQTDKARVDSQFVCAHCRAALAKKEEASG
jgi:hypothetical protein